MACRLDPEAQGLIVVLFAALTYAVIGGPARGWALGTTLGLLAVAAVAGVALVAHELGRREPLIDVRFFRSAPFSGASVIAVTAFAALGGFLFLNTLYLQDARSDSAIPHRSPTPRCRACLPTRPAWPGRWRRRGARWAPPSVWGHRFAHGGCGGRPDGHCRTYRLAGHRRLWGGGAPRRRRVQRPVGPGHGAAQRRAAGPPGGGEP